MVDRQRFTFRFSNARTYRSEEIIIIGSHIDDARVAAWTVLAEQEKDQAVRDSWRLLGTRQLPVWAWMKERETVAS